MVADTDDEDPNGQARCADVWETVVRPGLRRDLGARSFDQWLGRAAVADWCPVDRAVTLSLPSAFAANWVAANLGERLTLAWRAGDADVARVRVVADDRPAATILQAISAPSTTDAAPPVRFDPRLTFARFVAGPENLVGLGAARAVAAAADRHDPLYLHAATGQGKTHLLHAVGQAVAAAEPDARILSMSAERFMVEFVYAMRAKDTMAFKARLRSADVLLIDDFQFIAGKATTQEEFLHTFDELVGAGKRLILTADRAPHDLNGVDARLLSRLTQGLVVDIRPAGPALRRAIVARKAADAGVAVPDAVLDQLATRIASSVRELEGALNRLLAYAALGDRPIDLGFADEVLGAMFQAGRRRVSIEDVQTRVAEHFRIRTADMVSARRARDVARPRQIAMYLAKQLTPRSLPEIGRRFGGRDHTTVLHAIRQVDKLRGTDPDIDHDVRMLLRSLEG